MSSDDPFLAAQHDVLTLLHTTRPLLTSYLRIRSTATSATSPELLDARSELETALADLTTDLQDLVDSVQAVEGDPYRYGLEIDEVARRRTLVQSVGDEVEGMRREVERAVDANANASVNRKGRGGATQTGGGSGLPDPGAFASDDEEGEGDGYAAFEQERQQEILHEQDEALDGVFRTVGNLRQQADDMGRELEEQGELLESVDVLADRVGGKLQTGLKKVGWVIKKNEDSASSCCIGLLIAVLIVLLVLVLVL